MASYQLLQRAFITVSGFLEPQDIAAGSIVSFDGPPGNLMVPLDAAAAAAKANAIRERARQGVRVAKSPNYCREIARSLGVAHLGWFDQAEFIDVWINNPKPVARQKI